MGLMVGHFRYTASEYLQISVQITCSSNTMRFWARISEMRESSKQTIIGFPLVRLIYSSCDVHFLCSMREQYWIANFLKIQRKLSQEATNISAPYLFTESSR